MYLVTEVKANLEPLTRRGRICNQTWQAWKRAAGIPKGKRVCTHEQWVLLAAAVALHRTGRAISELGLKVFVRRNGSDPMEFLPGLLPIGARACLPNSCLGAELAFVIADQTGFCPSEWTLRRWVKRIGLGKFSRNRLFAGAEINQLIRHYCQLRVEQVQRARRLALVA